MLSSGENYFLYERLWYNFSWKIVPFVDNRQISVSVVLNEDISASWIWGSSFVLSASPSLKNPGNKFHNQGPIIFGLSLFAFTMQKNPKGSLQGFLNWWGSFGFI